MQEAEEQPPHMILLDPHFVVYQGRRRKLIRDKVPPGLPCERPVTARDWRAYLNRMTEEPPWERAWRYRLMMSHQGFKSIRAHFTEKRLRQLVRERRPEGEILREIEQVAQGASEATCPVVFATPAVLG